MSYKQIFHVNKYVCVCIRKINIIIHYLQYNIQKYNSKTYIFQELKLKESKNSLSVSWKSVNSSREEKKSAKLT